uniref:EF-hand domain-containing protein n=1 Tax=Sinocyclocheilus grahami TaxID=75366 RepID=A0A672NTN5_SINGR
VTTPIGNDDWRRRTKQLHILFYYFFFTASSVQSVADENLSLMDIEKLLLERVKDKKEDLKAAFESFDQEGNKAVTKGEFRRVIEGFLVPLTESQFEGLLAKIDLRENGTISYMEFLRRYCKISSAVGHLKNITRAFRLFDYNSDGQIQQHELRKVLEGYCFPMSQLEFHRSRLVEKALQAFDITDSGYVSQEDLRSVLSNFLFPMDDHTLRELLNRYEILAYRSCTSLKAILKFI